MRGWLIAVFGPIGMSALLTMPVKTDAQPSDPCRGQTQADMTACASDALRVADAELNTAYRELMAKISDNGKTLLRDSQRAWIAYRDKQCEFNAAGSQGGSVQPMVRANCLADLTKRQTEVLKAQLQCAEGDVACGNQ